MLLRVPAVLSKTQLREVRDIIDHATWSEGSITAGTQSAKAKKNFQKNSESLSLLLHTLLDLFQHTRLIW